MCEKPPTIAKKRLAIHRRSKSVKATVLALTNILKVTAMTLSMTGASVLTGFVIPCRVLRGILLNIHKRANVPSLS